MASSVQQRPVGVKATFLIGFGAALVVLLTLLPASSLAQAPQAAEASVAPVTPREVDDYSQAFGVSPGKAEASLTAQHRGAGIVEELEGRLGTDYAGVWFDNEAGEFVVPVLGDGARAQANDVKAQRELAELRLTNDYRTEPVTFSWDALEAVQDEIAVQISGLVEPGQVRTALDAATNSIMIELAGETSRQEKAALKDLARKAPVAVELQISAQPKFDTKVTGCYAYWMSCGPPLRGGNQLRVHQGNDVCTIGFRARGFNEKWYALTAGHCMGKWWEPTIHWASWDDGPQARYIGELEQINYPTHDWAKIDATNSWWDNEEGGSWPSKVVKWSHFLESNWPHVVNEYYPIEAEANPYQGQFVYHTGQTTGTSGGVVKTTNQTLEDIGTSYGKVTIKNLARVEGENVCIYEGDSGGPVYAASTGLGLVSIGEFAESFPCEDSKFWFVKLPEVTSDLGVTVVGSPPSVTTGSATNLGPYQATLHGEVNPNAWETHSRFEYGKGGYTNSTPEYYDSSGTSWISRSRGVTDLDPASSYQFRHKATNALGTTYGPKGTFTTPPAPPKATTESVSNIRVEDETGKATLNGKVNPGGANTDYRFEWGKASEGFPNKAPVPDGDAGNGITYVSVPAQVSGLKGLTEYQYRIRAENSEGTVTSGVTKFTTPDWRPQIQGVAGNWPYKASEDTASLPVKGEVKANGFATDYHFEWGTQAEFEEGEYGNVVPLEGAAVGSGLSFVLVEQELSGLKGSTTYHFRMVAENVEGETLGVDETFTTPDWRPRLWNLTTAGVDEEAATLAVSIYPNLFDAEYRFEWGLTDAYGDSVPIPDGEVEAGLEYIGVDEQLDGLQPSQVYHYRVVAENADGVRVSSDKTFTTPPAGAFEAGSYPVLLSGQVDGETLLTGGEGWGVECVTMSLVDEEEYGEVDTAPRVMEASPSNCHLVSKSPSVALEMNDCTLSLHAGPETSEDHFKGTVAIGPPGCGPVTFVLLGTCTVSVPAQEGLDAEYVNEGSGSESTIRLSLSSALAVKRAGGTCAGQTPIYGSGHWLGEWDLEGEVPPGIQGRVGLVPYYGVEVPKAVTNAPVGVSEREATLKASITPNWLPTDYQFEYVKESEFQESEWANVEAAPATATEAGSGGASIAVSEAVDGLAAGTAYRVRVVADNSQGSASGSGVKFTTTAAAPPRVEAEAYPASLNATTEQEIGAEAEFLDFGGLKVECAEATFAAEATEATDELAIDPTYKDADAGGNCRANGLLITYIDTNSCGYELDVLNAGPPYEGTLGIACAEEGDAIEIRVRNLFNSKDICQFSIAQQDLGAVDLGNSGEGKERQIGLDIGVEDLTYTLKSESELCGQEPETEETHEDGGYVANLFFAGTDEGEEPVGVFLAGEET